eukprot:1192812-Prorocentrum_minimum.AAC.2
MPVASSEAAWVLGGTLQAAGTHVQLEGTNQRSEGMSSRSEGMYQRSEGMHSRSEGTNSRLEGMHSQAVDARVIVMKGAMKLVHRNLQLKPEVTGPFCYYIVTSSSIL